MRKQHTGSNIVSEDNELAMEKLNECGERRDMSRIIPPELEVNTTIIIHGTQAEIQERLALMRAHVRGRQFTKMETMERDILRLLAIIRD